jgi:glycosyltransferase involved in cell wall biosynthesis
MQDKIRYCVDLQALQGESRSRGIGRYTKGFTEAIIHSGRVEPYILLNTALNEGFWDAHQWVDERLPKNSCKVFTGLNQIMGLLPGIEAREVRASILYDQFVATLEVDWVHNSAPFDGMGDDTTINLAIQRGASSYFRSATLYDLIPFQEPDQYLIDSRYRNRYYSRLNVLKNFDLIFAISEYTRNIAIDEFGFSPDNVVVISTDTTCEFRPLLLSEEAKSSVLKKYGIIRPFVIHTGILETRKNTKTLIEAFSRLPGDVRRRFQLVFAGNATSAQILEMSTYARQLGLGANDLNFIGFVNDGDLAALYNIAQVLVMPSFSEGFGLPLLEAMRCGAPVLGANATAIPEVIGSSDYMFNPHKSADLTRALFPLLTNPDTQNAARQHSIERQAHFSWKQSAERAIDAIYEKQARRTTKTQPFRALPFHASSAEIKEAGKILTEPTDVDIVVNESLGVPAAILTQRELREDQEETITQGPFCLISRFNVLHSKSTFLKYLVDGYASLNLGRSDENYVLGIKNIGCLANNFGWISNEGSGHEGCDVKILEKSNNYQALLSCLRELPKGLTEIECAEMAQNLVMNFYEWRGPARLFVDITELAKRDAGTGIQRVVRNIVSFLISADLPVRVEPIFRDGDRFRYARVFCTKLLNLNMPGASDDYVYFSKDDIFLGLDLDALIDEAAMRRLAMERMRGVNLIWVVYDVLPILHPEWFDDGLANAVQSWLAKISVHADQLVCISRAVADQVYEYLQLKSPNRKDDLALSWWHLGANLDDVFTGEIRAHEVELLPDGITTFLTVGTIEPRKGIEKLLDNAEFLWASGHDLCFVLVGRRGWNVDELMKRIIDHPQFGHRLIWFENLSDSVLDQLYPAVTAVILPSEGEGFGLPLVEAARHGTPIIARDLPVFREIGGTGVYFFKNDSERGLANGIIEWLNLHAVHEVPDPKGVQILTWRESSLNLLDATLKSAPYKIWRPSSNDM